MIEVTGVGHHTSLWTSSRGSEPTKSDLLKGNWCILPLRQCLQWLSEADTGLLQKSKVGREDSVVLSTLSLGWPSLWCHSSHFLCDFCTWKDVVEELCSYEGVWLNCVEEEGTKCGDMLLKSFG